MPTRLFLPIESLGKSSEGERHIYVWSRNLVKFKQRYKKKKGSKLISGELKFGIIADIIGLV
jgi:hypothetical protein